MSGLELGQEKGRRDQYKADPNGNATERRQRRDEALSASRKAKREKKMQKVREATAQQATEWRETLGGGAWGDTCDEDIEMDSDLDPDEVDPPAGSVGGAEPSVSPPKEGALNNVATMVVEEPTEDIEVLVSEDEDVLELERLSQQGSAVQDSSSAPIPAAPSESVGTAWGPDVPLKIGDWGLETVSESVGTAAGPEDVPLKEEKGGATGLETVSMPSSPTVSEQWKGASVDFEAVRVHLWSILVGDADPTKGSTAEDAEVLRRLGMIHSSMEEAYLGEVAKVAQLTATLEEERSAKAEEVSAKNGPKVVREEPSPPKAPPVSKDKARPVNGVPPAPKAPAPGSPAPTEKPRAQPQRSYRDVTRPQGARGSPIPACVFSVPKAAKAPCSQVLVVKGHVACLQGDQYQTSRIKREWWKTASQMEIYRAVQTISVVGAGVVEFYLKPGANMTSIVSKFEDRHFEIIGRSDRGAIDSSKYYPDKQFNEKRRDRDRVHTSNRHGFTVAAQWEKPEVCAAIFKMVGDDDLLLRSIIEKAAQFRASWNLGGQGFQRACSPVREACSRVHHVVGFKDPTISAYFNALHPSQSASGRL